MIYSADVLFVHIPKAGGLSARKWLFGNLPGARDQEGTPGGNGFPVPHVPLRDVERWTGRPLNSFKLIVAIVRDPYEQALSQWVHWRDGFARGGRHPCEWAAGMYGQLHHWLLEPLSDWRFWYEGQYGGLTEPAAYESMQQTGFYEWFLQPFPGNLTVLRFGDFAQRLPELCAPHLKAEATPFPHENRSVQRDARQYYNGLSVKQVRDRFRWTWRSGYYQDVPAWQRTTEAE